MEPIIDPVDNDAVAAELTQERFLRHTNKGKNEIYVVDAHTSPCTMTEIGRLREWAFRSAGGGTGKACDIDEFDTMPRPCQQLIVWNPEEREIVGGYRFIYGEDIEINGNIPRIATSHMFNFSEKFLRDYLPITMELGRSFVSLKYQSTKAGSKSIYSLDNLWDGLGALTVLHPSTKYLFGKVTMYPSYSRQCRDILLYFLHTYFPDPDKLVWPMVPLVIDSDPAAMHEVVTGEDFKSDYLRVNKFVRLHGYNIPPLVNAYISLSPSMRMFGTAINHEFGEVEESGIFFSIAEITEEKKSRHINTFDSTEAASYSKCCGSRQ